MASVSHNLVSPLKNSREHVLHEHTDHQTLLHQGVPPAQVACELMRQKELTYPVQVQELVKLVKDQYRYIPIEDLPGTNNLQKSTPLESSVKSRTLHQFGYISGQDKEWERKYKHYIKVLQAGHFTLPQDPYETLGNVVTDHRSLFLDHFDDDVSLQLLDKLATRGHTTVRRPEVTEDNSESKKQLICDFEKREKDVHDAGLHNIKQLLKETNSRIVATRAGQAYAKHVHECQAKRRAKIKGADDGGGMIIQELSRSDTDMLVSHTGGAIPITKAEVENEKTAFITKKFCRQAMLEWKRNTKRNKILHKLEYIYHLLCSLYNLRGRYLKSKNVLPLETVMSLRRNPFVQKSGEGKMKLGRGTVHTMSMESSLNIKGTSSFRHSDLHGDKSTIPSIYNNNLSPSSPMGSNNPNTGSRKISTSGTQDSHVQNVIVKARRNSILSNPPTSLIVSHSPISKISRPNRLMSLMQSTDVNKVETWDDLMNVGHKTKIMKLLKKQTPPWQMPMVNNEPVKSTKEKDEEHLKKYHPDESVNRMRANYLAVKERVVKNQKHDLEKLDRERMIKFKYKLATMGILEPLLEVQRDILKQVSKEAVRDPSLITETETIPWFDSLIQEAIQLGCRDDSQVCEYLSKIEKFLLEEITNIPSVKEKLCLITVSLPIKEICTPHVQYAIQFVLVDILDGTLDMLEDWQNYRKLYVIRAQ